MEDARYVELESNRSKELTDEEKREGWHFCKEWDYMLIHRDWPEAEACLCSNPNC